MVVSEMSPAVIEAVLCQLEAAGELESRTLPIGGEETTAHRYTT